ncbi:MAG: DUF2062 domain-containing protein [Nitrospiraceae bacterium]|nr:DUF2062 domain-containing protein [Nitrospiraceae bacterium]
MRKYIRDRFHGILKLNDPPHKLALAAAIGVFIAFSPWLGLHIVSCIFFAWIFRVSKVVVLTATFVNNPWTMVPMYAFNLWLGVKLTGSDMVIPEISWREIGFRELFTILKPFLWPFVAGSLVAGLVAGLASYFLFFWAVTRYRKADSA